MQRLKHFECSQQPSSPQHQRLQQTETGAVSQSPLYRVNSLWKAKASRWETRSWAPVLDKPRALICCLLLITQSLATNTKTPVFLVFSLGRTTTGVPWSIWWKAQHGKSVNAGKLSIQTTSVTSSTSTSSLVTMTQGTTKVCVVSRKHNLQSKCIHFFIVYECAGYECSREKQ